MRSMTGYGRAELERGRVRVLAEVRTLNQRFFESKFSLPRGWAEHEARMRKMVQGVVARGRAEVSVRCVMVKTPPPRLRVNEELAAGYVRELRRLGKRLRLDGKLGIDALLHRPEIFQVTEADADLHEGAELGMRALSRALKALDRERAREGAALKRDFQARITKVAGVLPRIERLADKSRAAITANYQERMRELLREFQVNEKRVYDEAAAAAQRADITEEITRLRTHLHGLRGLLARQGPVGKAIEFLLQEANREINTMGAKSQDPALSQTTIELKAEVEKMREQVQNVE
jgi:uncharacterized protein (TIGR00255 family)